MKRIEVEAASATAFNRLMREVATLSRLQHAHVVRYYQVRYMYTPVAAGLLQIRSCR